MLRSAVWRSAALVCALAACTRATPTPDAAPASADAAALSVEEQRYIARADSIRAALLAATTFTDFGAADECRGGVLRTFMGDTTAEARARTERLVEELERMIIARGIETPLDTPAGRALLRTIAEWEADLTRPKWDVRAGETAPPVIAAGIQGEFRNPATGKCERYTEDTGPTVVVLPEVPGFSAAGLDTAEVRIYQGLQGLNRARDYYFATAAGVDPIFTYSKVRVAVPWRDYAVVSVHRPAEHKGLHELAAGVGGGTYIFHRVGNEWRLLAIARTWG